VSPVRAPERLLLGSGPSPVPARVREAMAAPTVGHLDPWFGALMEETAASLRAVFGTDNRATLPVSGTGSAGMDAMVVNLVAPGDRVVCGVHGLFGERMADALARQGADVVRVAAEWGRAIPVERLIAALDGPGGRTADALFVVHGETSTGVAQPLDGLGAACRERDALLLLDCVTSLAGHPLRLDEAGVDAAFSGTQKCLNAPPGLAPFTVGPRAATRIAERGAPARSWYFDLALVLGYWQPGEGGGGAGGGGAGGSGGGSGAGGGSAGAPARAYHHTAPVNLVYALREALALVEEEGLQARWARHARAHAALRDALAVLGLERLAPEGEQLHPLLAVRVPDGVDDAAVRRELLLEDGVEISGGLGPLAGRLWRIGVMGAGAEPEPQERLVRALAPRLGTDPEPALAALRAGWGA